MEYEEETARGNGKTCSEGTPSKKRVVPAVHVEHVAEEPLRAMFLGRLDY